MQIKPIHRYVYQLGHRIIQKICNELIPEGRFPFNNKGFGGGGDAPSVPAASPIAPAPVPTQTSTGATIDGRQRQVAMLKYGALSTISNQGGAAGITGSGPDMYPSMTQNTSAKQTIGG